MLTLYVKTLCPYCALVQRVVKDLDISVVEKNIGDPTIAAELIKRGGKRQVPYLVDDEHKVEMYESEDIANYLSEKYGKGNGTTPPPAHGNVCPTDHGTSKST